MKARPTDGIRKPDAIVVGHQVLPSSIGKKASKVVSLTMTGEYSSSCAAIYLLSPGRSNRSLFPLLGSHHTFPPIFPKSSSSIRAGSDGLRLARKRDHYYPHVTR